ncbi:Uncharacterised protein [Mycobacteroides abscessus]|nr:Uncharacterised protein [Mycobacteroides abscessus]
MYPIEASSRSTVNPRPPSSGSAATRSATQSLIAGVSRM